MNTIAISDLRSHLPQIIKKVGQGLERFIVTVSGKPKAMIISLEELESLEETAEILATPGAYKKIMKGTKEAKKDKGISLDEFK